VALPYTLGDQSLGNKKGFPAMNRKYNFVSCPTKLQIAYYRVKKVDDFFFSGAITF
jgi:hypothetical protein